jgi:hypothetical protein
MESPPTIESLRALAWKEWEQLKAALELKCPDFVLKKDSNEIELARPGKTITFTFESERLGNEPYFLRSSGSLGCRPVACLTLPSMPKDVTICNTVTLHYAIKIEGVLLHIQHPVNIRCS